MNFCHNITQSKEYLRLLETITYMFSQQLNLQRGHPEIGLTVPET